MISAFSQYCHLFAFFTCCRREGPEQRGSSSQFEMLAVCMPQRRSPFFYLNELVTVNCRKAIARQYWEWAGRVLASTDDDRMLPLSQRAAQSPEICSLGPLRWGQREILPCVHLGRLAEIPHLGRYRRRIASTRTCSSLRLDLVSLPFFVPSALRGEPCGDLSSESVFLHDPLTFGPSWAGMHRTALAHTQRALPTSH